MFSLLWKCSRLYPVPVLPPSSIGMIPNGRIFLECLKIKLDLLERDTERDRGLPIPSFLAQLCFNHINRTIARTDPYLQLPCALHQLEVGPSWCWQLLQRTRASSTYHDIGWVVWLLPARVRVQLCWGTCCSRFLRFYICKSIQCHLAQILCFWSEMSSYVLVALTLMPVLNEIRSAASRHAWLVCTWILPCWKCYTTKLVGGCNGDISIARRTSCVCLPFGFFPSHLVSSLSNRLWFSRDARE